MSVLEHESNQSKYKSENTNMALKVYKTVDHSKRNTRYAYVCASSKSSVAKILKTTVGQLNKYGCTQLAKDDCKYSQYKHLQEGEVAFEDPQDNHSAKQGISVLDLHRISVLGYIDSAIQALNNCDMPNREMSIRLGQLRGDLKDLKDDAKEVLEHKYGGR